jgi:hypothetical protein
MSLSLNVKSYLRVNGVPVDDRIVEEGWHLDVKTKFLVLFWLILFWLKPEFGHSWLPMWLKGNVANLDGFLHQLLPFGRCR